MKLFDSKIKAEQQMLSPGTARHFVDLPNSLRPVHQPRNGRPSGGQILRTLDRAVFGVAAALFLWLYPSGVHGQEIFQQVTTGKVVTDLGVFTRPVWADFNNDGFLDLFVSGFSDHANVFYLNNGDGTFTKRTQGDPVIDPDFHSGCVAGDYDNDGSVDLMVAAGVISETPRQSKLYHNKGNAVFERADNNPINSGSGFFNSCAWVDYDNDGLLDMVVTAGSEVREGKAFLFHNEGDRGFKTANATPVTSDSNTGTAVWADYDGDGFMDLLIVNAGIDQRCLLYHNDRQGAFTRIETNAIASTVWPAGAVCSAWADYDNDGLPDVYINGGNGTQGRLYRNQGEGRFDTIDTGPMVETGGDTCVWGDYDNDGYLDLFVGSYVGPNSLFRNQGDGTFAAIDLGTVANDLNGMSPVLVDYDNDGFLDLFLTHAVFNGNLVANSLYHNNGNTNNWIEVKLVGTVANRSAIGAKVRIQATINGKTFWQMREINNGGGWNIQTLVAHFGLGNATNVQTVRIEWPSGTVQELQNISGKRIVTVTEPARLLVSASNESRLLLKGGRNLAYDVQTSSDLKTWTLLNSLAITSSAGTAPITDLNASSDRARYYRAVLR